MVKIRIDYDTVLQTYCIPMQFSVVDPSFLTDAEKNYVESWLKSAFKRIEADARHDEEKLAAK